MRIFLYLLSGIFLFDSLVLTARKSFTLGLAIMYFITISLFLMGRYLDFLQEITSYGIGFLVKIAALSAIGAYLALTCYVLGWGRTTANGSESAVIVLGSGLNRDGTPGPTLQKRLDGCLEYLKTNPGAYVVVSGSYSRQSTLTEARGMKNYLLSKGVEESKIITEDKAQNTRQNFENSIFLLKERGINCDNVAFVTNSFHVYRSMTCAKQSGIKNPKSISVSTDPFTFPPALLREVCGVAAMLVLGY